ncbi:BTAD domain-containing putative transcriptional regulator [Roseiflexus sp.]|uniref:AfsR/SARP family transcriptional regulator n=1 Tax=Roseiflexus sp. TaxID=2562120 RepID=UPI002583DA3B|nr:BTAD domain-containing putative transcriptional regulator [Roseiflexus sp.]
MTSSNHVAAHRSRRAGRDRPGWQMYRRALDLLQRQEWDVALSLLAEAEVVFRTTNDADGQWRALAAQAEIHLSQGHAHLAMARALAALTIIEHLDDPRACGLMAWRAALIALQHGDYRAAGAYLQRAQLCLDMADAAPPGGLLAATAQLCAEVVRWQQVMAQGRIDRAEGEAAIRDVRAELMRHLLAIHEYIAEHCQSAPEAWIWINVDLPPPPPMLTDHSPSLLQRFLAWWRSILAPHALPNRSAAPHLLVDDPLLIEEPPAKAEHAVNARDAPITDSPVEESARASETSLSADAPEDETPRATAASDVSATPEATSPVRGLTVYTFGTLRVYYNDTLIDQWEGVRSRSLFRFLIANRHAPISKERLAELFWPDSEPELARRSLHQAVYCLRQTFKRVIGDVPVVLFINDCYRLAPDVPLWVDSDAFEEAIAAARSAWSRGDMGGAIREYGRAIDLYQGDYMAEERYEDWVEERRIVFQSAYLEALHQLARTYQERKDYPMAIMLSQRALSVDSCDEDAHRVLIGCYAAQGLRHLAMRQYQACATALRSQLGLSPSDELEDFVRRVIEKTE